MKGIISICLEVKEKRRVDMDGNGGREQLVPGRLRTGEGKNMNDKEREREERGKDWFNIMKTVGGLQILEVVILLVQVGWRDNEI